MHTIVSTRGLESTQRNVNHEKWNDAITIFDVYPDVN